MFIDGKVNDQTLQLCRLRTIATCNDQDLITKCLGCSCGTLYCSFIGIINLHVL